MKATYQIDPAHSSVNFSVRHMMISNIRGVFTGVRGTAIYDPDDLAASSVTGEIDASSIHTFDAKRDEHLRSSDFLDIATHPLMTFRSTSIRKISEGNLKVTGDLTIRGVTKQITWDVEGPAPEGKDPWGNIRTAVVAKTTVNRNEFGVAWNAVIETGGFLVGHELKLELELQFVKATDTANAA